MPAHCASEEGQIDQNREIINRLIDETIVPLIRTYKKTNKGVSLLLRELDNLKKCTVISESAKKRQELYIRILQQTLKIPTDEMVENKYNSGRTISPDSFFTSCIKPKKVRFNVEAKIVVPKPSPIKARYTCECGAVILPTSRFNHEKSKSHLSFVEKQKELLQEPKPAIVPVLSSKDFVYSSCPRFTARIPNWLDDKDHCQWLNKEWNTRTGLVVDFYTQVGVNELIDRVMKDEQLYQSKRAEYHDPSWMNGLNRFDMQMNAWGFGTFLLRREQPKTTVYDLLPNFSKQHPNWLNDVELVQFLSKICTSRVIGVYSRLTPYKGKLPIDLTDVDNLQTHFIPWMNSHPHMFPDGIETYQRGNNLDVHLWYWYQEYPKADKSLKLW